MIVAKLPEPTGFMDCTRSGDARQATHLRFRPTGGPASGAVGVVGSTSAEAAPTARRTGCLSRRVGRLSTV
jgi:hypothetical protein